MKIEHLECLLLVYQHGSINKASQALHTSPQNISKIVKQCENELDAILFERRHHALQITPSGQQVIHFAQETLEKYAALKSALRDNPSGSAAQSDVKGQVTLVTNVTSSMACLTKILPAFSKSYPNIRVISTEVDVFNIYDTILQSDDAIGILPILISDDFNTYPKQYQDRLQFDRIFMDKFTVLVSKQSPLAQQQSITPRSILKHSLGLWAAADFEDSLAYQYLSHYGTPQLTFVTNNIFHFLNGISEDQFIGFSTNEIFKNNYSNLKNNIKKLALKGYHEYNHMLITKIHGHYTQASQLFIQFVLQMSNDQAKNAPPQ